MNEKQPLADFQRKGDHSPEAHATINDRTSLYLAILAFGLSALAVGMQISNPAMEAARTSEREARMAQYYIIEVDAKLIKAGVDLPDGGYEKFKEKRGVK